MCWIFARQRVVLPRPAGDLSAPSKEAEPGHSSVRLVQRMDFGGPVRGLAR